MAADATAGNQCSTCIKTIHRNGARGSVMVRGVKRLFTALALLVAVSAPLSAATAAHAVPPSGPTSVTITGEGAEPLTVSAETNPELFKAILDQVSWLRGNGHASSPKAPDLGSKYTVVVLVNDVAKQTYDLYPLASGGPRAFRPAKQPDLRKTTAAWFFGRLNMPETLRAAGMPLPEKADVMSGGIGGGERVIPDSELDPSRDLDTLLGELRSLLLLNGAVILLITTGLAGISLLVRRRTA
jgi:hypothetical protein